MAKYSIEDTTLTGIANAIRDKTGEAGTIPASAFAERISAISGGGSVDTCSVSLNRAGAVLVTRFVDGEVATQLLVVSSGTPITGVVCGSGLTAVISASVNPNTPTGAEKLSSKRYSASTSDGYETVAMYKITAEPGGTATITFSLD